MYKKEFENKKQTKKNKKKNKKFATLFFVLRYLLNSHESTSCLRLLSFIKYKLLKNIQMFVN